MEDVNNFYISNEISVLLILVFYRHLVGNRMKSFGFINVLSKTESNKLNIGLMIGLIYFL